MPSAFKKQAQIRVSLQCDKCWTNIFHAQRCLCQSLNARGQEISLERFDSWTLMSLSGEVLPRKVCFLPSTFQGAQNDCLACRPRRYPKGMGQVVFCFWFGSCVTYTASMSIFTRCCSTCERWTSSLQRPVYTSLFCSISTDLMRKHLKLQRSGGGTEFPPLAVPTSQLTWQKNLLRFDLSVHK